MKPIRKITFKLTPGEAAALERLISTSRKWVTMQHFCRWAVVERLEDEVGPLERGVQ